MEIANNIGLDQVTQQLTENRLLDRRTLFVSEGVNSAVAKRVINQLLVLDMDKPGTPINFFINSPGGEVNSGFAIYDTIRFLKSDVRIINTGLCASIATILNIAAKKQHRYSMPNCKFLIHQPLIPGQIYGQASDIEIHAREILKTRQKINELLAKECGQPLARVEKDTTRDYWMNASEALEYGLIHKIVENIADLG
ncbi:MAG: ATP-dependent Clp protease proteolytic subunit [Proteobacteria bacterium]|nr:ATP-dependent Clp protease proteolytic subunit [Pseudomonadota bacterium]